MNALKIIGVTALGAAIGAAIGVHENAKEGPDDLGFGFALYGGMGIICGGIVGVVVGAVIFA